MTNLFEIKYKIYINQSRSIQGQSKALTSKSLSIPNESTGCYTISDKPAISF